MVLVTLHCTPNADGTFSDTLEGSSLGIGKATTVAEAKKDEAWTKYITGTRPSTVAIRVSRLMGSRSHPSLLFYVPTHPLDALVFAALPDGIAEANKSAVSRASKIQKFAIVSEFSVPGGELTPTLKLKRPVVMKKYNDVIDTLY